MPGAGEMGAKAYRARLARESGIGSKTPFESDFGKKILMKYGWKEGEGLGRSKTGRTDCIQAQRREAGAGLGHTDKRKSEQGWDNWWADCFNSVAKKIKVSAADPSVSTNSGAEESDDSSDDESTSKTEGRITAVKKANVMGGKLRRVLRQETAAR
mmetsp:Transcript_55067/g.87344  ORF Transcript_55067/g.87344 Transcript_55067/m.87344 type:complete len:156 (+) Transcript_55067:55-522(+)